MTLASERPDMETEGATCGLTTIYNGSCPVCSFEIDHYRAQDARHGVGHAWVDLYKAGDLLQRYGLGPEEVKQRLHVVDAAGRVHAGVDAFLLIWRGLPGYGWLARLVGAPGIKPAAAFVYDRALAPALYAWNRRRERREAAGRALPDRRRA